MYDFEWDEVKNSINKSKHKIDFTDAVKVFFDERKVTRVDNSADYGEERYQVIGMTQQRVLFVVYTERSENTIRIISARKATKKEQKSYARFY